MVFPRLSRGAAGLLLVVLASARQSPKVPASPSAVSSGFTDSQVRELVPLSAQAADPIALRVVYPAPEDLVRVRDSSFLLGSVASGDVRVTINGSRVRVWPNGAWLAWLHFPADSVMQFRIEARRGADSTVVTYPVRRDRRYLPGEVRSGMAWVDSMSLTPRGQVWLPSGEYVALSARAVEGATVRLHAPDGSMIRLVPQRQPEEVLPAIRAFERDTAKLRTPDEVRYVGVIRGMPLGPEPGPLLRGPSPALVRVLARAALRCATGAQCPTPYADLLGPDDGWAVIEAAVGGDTVRIRWPLQLALLDTLPVVAEFDDDTTGSGKTDSLTPGRPTPGGAYQWFFPTGTRGAVTARVNDDLRIRLSPDDEAWIPVADARPLPPGLPSPRAVVGSVTVTPESDRVTLRIPLTQRVPFQVLEDDRSITLRFYSAVGDVDWIRYGGDALIRRLGWIQSRRDELTFAVDLAEPVWGYRTRWSRNDLVLEIRRPPRISAAEPLRGRVIALDPGHPPLGATGPTGLREADANLAVARRLEAMLKRAGARVVMTRVTDTAVDLWSRVAIAERGGAELLVSIHNNALPDGVNPFTNNGTSVFYNQPRSLPLAAEIQRSLVRRLRLPDLGIGKADLAVVRPTWLPAVLCEGMFLILPDQEIRLRSARGQRLYAQGVLEGVRSFLLDRARDQAAGVGQAGSGASPKANSPPPPRAPTLSEPEGVAP
jgi:N-acetylmuramoyl-L-alanine amidase